MLPVVPLMVSCPNVLYPYMVTQPCVIPIYGHTTMCYTHTETWGVPSYAPYEPPLASLGATTGTTEAISLVTERVRVRIRVRVINQGYNAQ